MKFPPRFALLTSIPSIVSAVTLAFSPSTYAASIIWGAPTRISGDADVSTTGTLLGAFNVGAPGVATTVVNGVTFAGLVVAGTSVTSGNFNLSIVGGFSNYNDAGSTSPPFSGLSAQYQTLLSSAAGAVSTPFTLTMSGLVVAQIYQFEWWNNDSAIAVNYFTTATAGNALTLATNGGPVGGVGQFGIGTFVADATTQVITFPAQGPSSLNGFQLRQVPEPATWAMLAIGGVCILACRQRSPRSV